MRLANVLASGTAILVALAPLAGVAQTLPWMNTSLPPEQRTALLVSAMTLDQKIQQIAINPVANTSIPGCGFNPLGRHIEGIPSLAIPTVRMTNAPAGVVGGDCSPDPTTTGLPDELAAASTWDTAVWSLYGDIVGAETRAIAHTITLGPGMDMGRVPNNGRNFEYLGEDPLLTGTAATLITRGIQAHGVLATDKHYVANEQETQRQTMNTIIDNRTLHELYLLPFEMGVKDGDTASVMCSYPRINGTFSCENAYILTTVLRNQWGFKGFVMSDRGATNSTVPSIKAGLDLEFATPNYFSPANINAALASGAITISDIDNMLKPRFYEMFKLGQFDNPITGFSIHRFRRSRPVRARHGRTRQCAPEERERHASAERRVAALSRADRADNLRRHRGAGRERSVAYACQPALHRDAAAGPAERADIARLQRYRDLQ